MTVLVLITGAGLACIAALAVAVISMAGGARQEEGDRRHG